MKSFMKKLVVAIGVLLVLLQFHDASAIGPVAAYEFNTWKGGVVLGVGDKGYDAKIFGATWERRGTQNVLRFEGAAEVEPPSLKLIEDSLFVIDTLQPDDPPSTHLSNFNVHEDRTSGDLLMQVPRLHVTADGAICGDGYH